MMLKRFWNAIRSTCQAHRGVILAALATMFWAACVGALNLESGFGLAADFLIAFSIALMGVPIAALLIAGILALLRLLPRLLAGFLLAAGLFISLLWFQMEGWVLSALLLLVECLLGASLFRLRHPSLVKRMAAWSVLVLTLGANIYFFSLLHSDGNTDELIQIKDKPPAMPPVLQAADPSQPGPYAVKTLYYGSGDSLRRPEFGPSVAIRTATVDASPFFKDFKGWKAWIRKRYWGFGMNKLPLNARVFYPDGAGPFPLFLIVHGNHEMSVPSDNGYAYLCQLLASRGLIAVSVDENFLDSGLFHDPPKQQPVRGWMLLEHLRLWHEWAKDAKNPFYGKVDLTRIALGGHSRGGEAAATAALFNRLSYDPEDGNIRFHYGYDIRSVVAIAPPDGQYKPAQHWRILQDVNYFTLQGANDSDVSEFQGSRQYDHVRFSGNVQAFKSELYIYRANHGQFNTMWGRTDIDVPASWFLNLRPLLAPEAQRQIAKVYISAFLEATLKGRSEYRDVFRDYRHARPWLPDTLYVNRFQDQTYKTICSFDEDADLTTTTASGGHISASGLSVWREAKIPFRDGDRDYNGVFLGWNRGKGQKPADYVVDVPPGETASALALSVAATDDNPQDKDDDAEEEKNEVTNFSIEAVGANGARARLAVNDFLLLLPPFHVQFTKLDRLDTRLYKNSAEPAFQTIHIPLDVFSKANPAFDGSSLRQIRLIFDKTPSRVIIVSGIGLEDK
jgi:acetyl esterase/lipase